MIRLIIRLWHKWSRRNWYNNKVDPQTRDAVFRAYGRQCLKCGSKNRVQIDHVVPKSWPHSSHDFSNLQPLCSSCNRRKGNLNANDYR